MGLDALVSRPSLNRSRPAAPDPQSGLSGRLTGRQQQQLAGWLHQVLQAPGWHGQLPVAVLEPCWLRLRRVPVERLAALLPPDGSEAAPELVHYRQLRHHGYDDWSAQQHCWQEFGSAAFQQAQQRFWQSQERGNHGWTLGRYLALLEHYRRSLEPGASRQLPLLLLATPETDELHQLFWLPAGGGPIGHTCP